MIPPLIRWTSDITTPSLMTRYFCKFLAHDKTRTPIKVDFSAISIPGRTRAEMVKAMKAIAVDAKFLAHDVHPYPGGEKILISRPLLNAS